MGVYYHRSTRCFFVRSHVHLLTIHRRNLSAAYYDVPRRDNIAGSHPLGAPLHSGIEEESVNLAKGTLAMPKVRVIVKRLHAIQNFGAMDVLCIDKTGTLTQDRIVLKRHLDVRGKESTRVLQYAYLNSQFQSGLKNLLDVAVLEHVELHGQFGIDENNTKIDEIPLDFTRRRLAVVVAAPNEKHVLVCKGGCRGDVCRLPRVRGG